MINFPKRSMKTFQGVAYASSAVAYFPAEEITRGVKHLAGRPVESQSVSKQLSQKSLHKFRRAFLGRVRTEQVEQAHQQATFLA